MDIARIFKSKTRKALFRLYYTNPEREYYLRELERLLHIPVSMLRKELLSLEKSGIFASKKRGNLSYFFLNTSHPLFSELKSIVFKTVGITGTLKKELSKLKGIKAAFLYGSFAKGKEYLDSDIDLCIIGRPSEDILVRKVKRLEDILQREINYSIYDRDDFNRRRKEKGSFIHSLLKEDKIFLIGSDNDL